MIVDKYKEVYKNLLKTFRKNPRKHLSPGRASMTGTSLREAR